MLKFGIPTLVLRQFDINENATEGSTIEITGRATGLISWLLTVMKLSTLTTLRLDADRLSVVTAGLSGEIHTVMPLGAIESTQCGYSKTVAFLAIAIGSLLFGLTTGEMGAFLVFLVIAVAFFVGYFLSDKMFVSVTAGGINVAIAYKKGVIDGVSVDLDRTLQAIQVLNQKIIQEHSKG